MIEEALKSIVARGELAGAVTLIWRDGQVVDASSVGLQDSSTGRPMRRDTLFRIASMTKPITSTVALMLHEEGRFELDDPISRWAPELSDLRVLVSSGSSLDDTVPAGRDITFGDLLTHRSGITYADFHSGTIAKAYEEALGRQIDCELPPDEWIARLGGLPLIDEPGRNFHYGHSTDLLGFLLARMEDALVPEIFARRVFQPLGMADTGFTVPPEKTERCAANQGFDDRGGQTVLERLPGGHGFRERPPGLTFFSGGQGLWSTADDYVTFARMFVEGGTVDGVQLLQSETLALMMTNQLTEFQRSRAEMLGRRPFAAGHGYGMGVAVVTDPETADLTLCGGGVGAVGWPGAYGSWWQADPNDGSVMVFLTHNMVTLDQLANGIGLGVWDAIAQFHALGSASKTRSQSRPEPGVFDDSAWH